MATREPLDPDFPLAQQLACDGGPVVLANIFTMPAADEAVFRAAWREVAIAMKAQPGFIAVQLMRAVGLNPTYLGESVWETVAAVGDAFSSPAVLKAFAGYPEAMVVKPHLFEKVAVPGICVA